MASWGVAEAKAKLSEVLDRAETEGPQLLRRRKREFYVLTKKQMEARAEGELRPEEGKERNMAEFLRSSPLRGSGLQVKRSKSPAREVRF